jgi:hypothetical protein
MARNRRLHRSGSSGLRSPILKRHPNVRILRLRSSQHDSLLALSELHAGENWVDMFFKSKAPEKDKNAAVNAAEVIRRTVLNRSRRAHRCQKRERALASALACR